LLCCAAAAAITVMTSGQLDDHLPHGTELGPSGNMQCCSAGRLLTVRLTAVPHSGCQ
jgi:hypothetical protein